MPDILCQPPTTISKAIDDSRTLAKRCAVMAYRVGLLGQPGARALKNRNIANGVSREVAALGKALGDASVFAAVEHWFTRPEPVKIAGVYAGSVHGVTLELAKRIHRAAARAIERVHDEATVRKLQQSEDDGSPQGVRVRSRQYSPFVITYQTDSDDLLEAWHPETLGAVQDSLSDEPRFDVESLLGMIDCEWGGVKQSFETRSPKEGRLRRNGSSGDGGTDGVASETAPVFFEIGSNWQEPVIVRGHRKRLSYVEWKAIRALFDAGCEGMSQNELEDAAVSARGIIRGLRRRDEDWKAVLIPAGEKGGRYRLVRECFKASVGLGV